MKETEDLEILINLMHHINVIRENEGLPIFKSLPEYLKWRESEIEYDN